MHIKKYNSIPDEARKIRTEVFIDEQGFVDEFDETDKISTHFVLFADEIPVATCRVFKKDSSFILGRVAVLIQHRGKGYGSAIVTEAENHIKKIGSDSLILHSQCRMKDFYLSLGYKEFGDIEYEEDCPHIWMKKQF